ncbi:MAG: YicC family protein [Rhodobacter sp.]|nr:YicC family protein [Rhodobacter sp.]
MVKSMTGFASARGEFGPYSWTWDMRAVNARGLDVRLRLPDWVEGLEAAVRSAVTDVVARGNVSVGMKLARDAASTGERLDFDALERVLGQMAEINAAAAGKGLQLAPASATDVLGLRNVLVSDTGEEDTAPLARAIVADLPALVADFDAMRQTEGAALADVMRAQLDQIEALTAQAASMAEARKTQMADRLRENLARVIVNAEGADPDRVAQELAMIAVKTDVTEEIDRLGAHVAAARDLLAADGAVGRKLDFLSQEFNREANTLCSKAQSADLTRVGLDLKATIDQMREQVQNVE